MGFFSSGSDKSIARSADKERDSKNWKAAADLYQKFLSKAGFSKSTFRYVVQLGNCLKESGNYAEALAAYDVALKIDSQNSDLHLQRGHVQKLMGQLPAATYSYQQAYNLDPSNEYAKGEIERSGGLAVAGKPLSASDETIHTIWFDVTDFMAYARHNVSLSGIQRVIANLALHSKRLTVNGYRIVPVIPEYDNFRILAARLEAFIDLVDVFDEPIVQRQKIDSAMEKVYKSREQVQMHRGDLLIVAGAFWIFSHYDLIMHHRHVGVRFGLFIHDLIQIRMPEYVAKDAHDSFHIQLSDSLDLCDFVLANSEYVATDIRDYLLERKNYTLPVSAVVLPTELRTNGGNARTDDRKILELAQRDYVLVVSTIEIRKNHKLIIKVWEKLREEFGEATPYLAFVGKWGWEIDDLRTYINENGYIDDWLFIFNGISDNDMEFLYKHCMFSVYPSFAEGFGLPIGESLVYGKPCIASDTTSMPEVGGKFVRYIDPFDWKKSYPVIRQAVVDRDDLKAWQDWIQREFTPKTWEEFSSEFFSAVVDNAWKLKGAISRPNCYLPSCEMILGGSHDILQMARGAGKIITFRSARKEWWHPANHWGAWSQNRRCQIEFISDCVEGEIIDLFLRLHRDTGRQMDPIAIANAGTGDHAFTLSEHANFFKLSGVVRKDGVVHVDLLARGKYPDNDHRGIFIGWSAIAYCRQGDAQALMRTYDAIICPGRHPADLQLRPVAELAMK